MAKPRLLLHTCCGVCGAWVPQELSRDYEVDLYFFNPNIHPQEEYEKRLEAARIAADKLNLKLIEGLYEPEKWHEAVQGLESEPEGGERCGVCFDSRLAQAGQYAKAHAYDYFATTLTIGRNKKAEIINPIGEMWSKQLGVKFLARDFKKKGGQNESNNISNELGLYRQTYCGCIYSMKKN